MKYKIFFCLFCGIFLSSFVWMSAQTGQFYSTESGLSSSLINHLVQDSRGYIWCATEYGLSRFDGLRFNNYEHISADTSSLKNNYVRTLFEDCAHNLYVGCIDGLLKYNRDSDTFAEIPLWKGGKQVYPHVTHLEELHDGTIWLSTSGQGMFRLDVRQMTAFSVDELLLHGNDNYQSVFYEDSNHCIWIGTEGSGLICYNPQKKKSHIFKTPDLPENQISAIIEDMQGNLFVGMKTQGLARYDCKQGQFVSVPSHDGKHISVYCMANVGDKLLVGTDGQGLMVYNAQTKCLEDYSINNAPLDFSDGKVHSILKDKDENLWIGLFQKGIVLMPKQENPFNYWGRKSIYYNPIGQGCVMALLQDQNRHLWVGTDNEGIFELDPDGRRIHHYQPGHGEKNMANTVMSMFIDSEDNFWLGTYTRGLGKMDPKTGICSYMPELAHEKILSLTEDKKKNLYVATLGSGIYRYNLLTKKLTHFESSKDENGDRSRNELANDWVNHVYCDREGMIWIAHYKGISCFNPQTNNFLQYNGSNLLIEGCVGYSLKEDGNGIIWAGTTEGLFSFNKISGSIKQFTKYQGLPSNVICGICEDGQNNIWVSTYNGICKYIVDENRFVNYYTGDGLQGNEFMHGAFYQALSGKIFFGGMDGVTSFFPDAIVGTCKDTKVWITDFYIFQQPVYANTLSGGHPVIQTTVQDASEFHLSASDNTFSIMFSTFHYNNPRQISYQYRIEEFGQKWLTTEPGVNRVTYNNLPSGKYTFSVCAVDHGIKSDMRTIQIFIAPHWYATWWAYSIYVSLLVLFMLFIISYLRARLRNRRERLERLHAEQLNEAKLQFFINISHEIRTPMTLIINPLEKLLKECPNEDLKKTYVMIYRNAQRILRLINQLMDIRKIDKGQMFMKFRETDMVGFINDVMLTFDYTAHRRNIHFSFSHDMPQLKVWVDMNNFDKILMNVLSNAFKYTPDGGEIQVSLTTGENLMCKDALKKYAEIVVSDTGIGIDKNEIEQIFERFYQINNDVTKINFGTGIGLHLSRTLVEMHHGQIFAVNREDTHGSRFIIRIPLGVVHLQAHELEKDDETHTFAENQHLLMNSALMAQVDVEEEVKGTEEKPRKAKSHLHVLIVEDEEEIRSYLKAELQGDYRIHVCENGKKAYEWILQELPDLVVSDIMMPEMDGLTLCKKIKQNTNTNHIPVILLTAKTTPEDRLEGIDTGADAYLAKPFQTELLKSTIANLLSNRRLLRNKFSGNQQQEGKIEKISLTSNDEKLMERIMKVVNEHMNDSELNVEMLAAEVGLSRVHIHRKLKELTNLSPREFIKNIRLQQAAILLAEDRKLSISEVAYAIGYSNLSNFSSAFRDKYGMSPTEYSQRHTSQVNRK